MFDTDTTDTDHCTQRVGPEDTCGEPAVVVLDWDQPKCADCLAWLDPWGRPVLPTFADVFKGFVERFRSTSPFSCACGARRDGIARTSLDKCETCHTFSQDHEWAGGWSDPGDAYNPRCMDCDTRYGSHGIGARALARNVRALARKVVA